MKLKFVTFNTDQEQFLVKVSEILLDADANDRAIQESIRANKMIGDFGNPERNAEMNDPSNYEVNNVDFGMLAEIIKRNDFLFRNDNVIAFRD